MARFLFLWEINSSYVPVDPKERSAGWKLLLEMVKKDMERGITKDWGAFPGEGSGYSVMEGTEVEVMAATQQFTPYVHFEVHPVATVAHIEDLLKVMSGE